MNIKYGIWILLALATVASAEVYKWTDDQGNVHYGDLPPGQFPAEPMTLPGLSTYKNRPVPPPPATPATPAEPGAPFTGYRQIAIVQPEPEGTVRANDGSITVSITLDPPLQKDHAMAVLLDGRAIGDPSPATTVALSGVNRGQHQVQAQVVDAKGKVLIQSASVTFFLRQASIIKPSNPAATP